MDQNIHIVALFLIFVKFLSLWAITAQQKLHTRQIWRKKIRTNFFRLLSIQYCRTLYSGHLFNIISYPLRHILCIAPILPSGWAGMAYSNILAVWYLKPHSQCYLVHWLHCSCFTFLDGGHFNHLRQYCLVLLMIAGSNGADYIIIYKTKSDISGIFFLYVGKICIVLQKIQTM